MLDTIMTVISTILGLFLAVWAVITFRVPPIFSRKRLSYKLKLSTPLMHESVKSTQDLVVKYGINSLKSPHVVQVRVSNVGPKAVPSTAFDQGSPLRFDLGVKIVALLDTTFTPGDMPNPKVRIDETELNVGPSLIPHQAKIDFVLLADGPCAGLAPTNPLKDVDLKQESDEQKKSISIKTLTGWAAAAFIVWFVVEQPTNAGHIAHNIVAFLSSLLSGATARL